MREGLIFNLTEKIDIEVTEKKLKEYEDWNKQDILRNLTKLQQAKWTMEETIWAECRANPWMRRNLEGYEHEDVEMEVQ